MKSLFLLGALGLSVASPTQAAPHRGSPSIAKAKSSRGILPKKARKKTAATRPPDEPAAPASPTDSAPSEEHEPRVMTKEPSASPLEVSLAALALHRRQTFHDDLFGSLRGFAVPVAPGLRLSADLYPAAFFTTGSAGAWGLRLTGEWAGGMRIQEGAGQPRSLETYGFSAALQRRYSFSSFQLGTRLGGAYQRFDLPEPEIRGATSVSVGYVSVGGGVDARVQLSRQWHLSAALGYQRVVSSGPMSAQFPHATGGVVEASASLGVGLLERTELRLGASVRSYHFALSPEPGDPLVAGGASDLFASGQLAIAYRL